jgi:galactose mutarotase-like enzyme
MLLALAAGNRFTVSDDKTGEIPLKVLRDEQAGLEVAIAPTKGGEITSLRYRFKGNWIETLYLARDYSPRQGWTGKAPWLWPATGRNFPKGVKANEEAVGSSYEWQGKRYPMPIHGFVKDMAWKLESESANAGSASVKLSLRDTVETRKMYPFGFQLSVEYVVTEGRLDIAYTAVPDAANSGPMPFSAGNHITFRTPLVEGSDPLMMRFQTPSKVEYMKGPGSIPNGEKRARSFSGGARLGEIEKRQAVSLGGYTDKPYMTLRDPAGVEIRMEHEADTLPAEPVIRFNVWGDAGDGYFSPEPWVGLQNSLNLRQGIVELAPGKQWQWRLRIAVAQR